MTQLQPVIVPCRGEVVIVVLIYLAGWTVYRYGFQFLDAVDRTLKRIRREWRRAS